MIAAPFLDLTPDFPYNTRIIWWGSNIANDSLYILS